MNRIQLSALATMAALVVNDVVALRRSYKRNRVLAEVNEILYKSTQDLYDITVVTEEALEHVSKQRDYLISLLEQNGIEPTEFDQIVLNNLT